MAQMISPFSNPICVALDVDSDREALRLAEDLSDIVGGFKVGPRLCLRYGQDLIKRLSSIGPVFIDNKHFDIPTTMVAALRASFESGASLATVHALSGREALESVAQLEKELNKERFFKVLAVTILTSWDQKSLPWSLREVPIGDHVSSLSEQCLQAGLSGLVCSPHELELLQGRNHYLVTPGVRFANDGRGDQKRVMSPKEAISKGSQLLVVGRPIIEASNPREVATDYVKSVYE